MKTIKTPEEMRAWSLECKKAGKTIGFVPTMGALHAGHASLMQAAAQNEDVGVVSIFVNPTQFAPTEDFNQYPRTVEADMQLAETIGIDVVYTPSASVMYPEGYATYVQVERLTQGLCGKSRPTFFRGVTTVVAKLFNAVHPDRAYFGQKDAQQCCVIKRMARDMDFGVEIVEMPIVREVDGLAMSSRNRYLRASERSRALCLSQSLFEAERLLHSGEQDANVIRNVIREGMKSVEIDYIEIVNADTMTPVDTIEGKVLVAIAARVGNTRLIDNIKFDAAGIEGKEGSCIS